MHLFRHVCLRSTDGTFIYCAVGAGIMAIRKPL
jgi:hypothetical protein